MIAALYVDPRGAYAGLPDVDLWDEARDARKYAGPWPVVAHPPCNRWAQPLAQVNETRYGHKVGDDGGCFEAALRAVRAWGGVLEHPANTFAWKHFNLPRPARGQWVPDLFEPWGWVTEVSQVAYGCQTRKRTWLYAYGHGPPQLDWSEPPHTHVVSHLQGTKRVLPVLSKAAASKTPPAFRDVLLGIARSCQGIPS